MREKFYMISVKKGTRYEVTEHFVEANTKKEAMIKYKKGDVFYKSARDKYNPKYKYKVDEVKTSSTTMGKSNLVQTSGKGGTMGFAIIVPNKSTKSKKIGEFRITYTKDKEGSAISAKHIPDRNKIIAYLERKKIRNQDHPKYLYENITTVKHVSWFVNKYDIMNK